jgi:hypothetical protein
MQYTHLKTSQLKTLLRARDLPATGGWDACVTRLVDDDKERGSEATTVKTKLVEYVERPLSLATAGFGRPVDPASMVGCGTFIPPVYLS